MLICSDSRVYPTNINIMTLQSRERKYFYVHRSLYDQAVIIRDRYNGKEGELVDALGWTDKVPDCVAYFRLVVPEPLDILGFFLLLIRDCQQLDDDGCTIEDLCGAIHSMSTSTNFRNMLKFPKDVRSSISFSLTIKEEYELSWDRFFQESIPYDEDMFLIGARAYVGQVSSNLVGKKGNHSYSDEEEDEEDEDEEEIVVTDLSDLEGKDLFNTNFSIDWDNIGSAPTTTAEEKDAEEDGKEGEDTSETEEDTGLAHILELATRRKKE